MFRVALGYSFLLLGIAIYNENNVEGKLDYVYIVTMLFPIFGLFYNFKYFTLIYCFITCVIYAYSFSSFHNMNHFQKILKNQIDFIRYGFFYTYVTLSIKDRTEATQRLPYYGVVSNFGYIIENRIMLLHQQISIPLHKNIQAGVATLIAIICFSITKANFTKSNLYNDVTKYGRGFIQSGLLVCSYITTYIILKNIEKTEFESTKFLDAIPLISGFSIIFLNQCILKYINFEYRIYFGLFVNILSTILLNFFKLEHYILKVVMIVTIGFHYMISDPCRYMFYILHSETVIPYYITTDIIGLCISKLILEFYNNLYLNYAIIPIWITLVFYSKKLNEKDEYCERCVLTLEV